MRFKHLSLVLGFAILLVCSAVFSQIVTTRVLVERDSIKVIVADTFPKDLSSEIHVGQRQRPSIATITPSFSTEGKDGQLEAAHIKMGLGPIVSVLRKASETEGYLLSLFSEDEGGKTFAMFDLNIDGEWDVKKTPTRERKNFIHFGGEWHEVDRIEGLNLDKPTAVSGETRFVFQKNKWISVSKTPVQ